jgi:hypothetical protein
MQLTLLSQRNLKNKLQEKNILRYKTMEQLKNLKNGPFSYLCLARTNHTYHQKPNPSRDTVPLIKNYE